MALSQLVKIQLSITGLPVASMLIPQSLWHAFILELMDGLSKSGRSLEIKLCLVACFTSPEDSLHGFSYLIFPNECLRLNYSYFSVSGK